MIRSLHVAGESCLLIGESGKMEGKIDLNDLLAAELTRRGIKFDPDARMIGHRKHFRIKKADDGSIRFDEI